MSGSRRPTTGGQPDERPAAADHGHALVTIPGVYFRPMSPGNDNQVDWTAASTPEGDKLVANPWRQQKPRTPPLTKRGVMDTLLGENNLSASDVGGSDPYNTTGSQFRR
jgi:hypothetical protein